MITPAFQQILLEQNQYFDNDIGELNKDLLKILNYTLMHYSRNVFNYDGKWNKIKKTYDFDYDYVNETKSSSDLIKIEKQFRKYARFFKDSKSHNDEHKYMINEYKKFISESMDIMVNKIIIPIECIMQRNEKIIEKYRQQFKKEPKKSSKINYKALEKLQFKLKN